MEIHEDLSKAAQIQPEERDYYLEMRSPDWGQKLRRWERVVDPALHFTRCIPVHRTVTGTTKLAEMILPFPSAPIYGINRKAEYGKSLEHRPNMHSLRLLLRPDSAPIHRLFVLHNGLNEAGSMKFYYRLADWIMGQQEATPGADGVPGSEGVACLVMPFPGHLTHASYHGPFAETPLSRYLSDAGDLYRQFLRYMVGMRWLLSIVADSDAEKWMVGGNLLPVNSRVDELMKESATLHKMSAKRVARSEEMSRGAGGEPAVQSILDIGTETSRSQVEGVDSLLRAALGRDSEETPDALRVHVVGYSLGGFVAQSVFFAWPQVVSSCTTICSGGAISDLSPTAFAQPEEWQSVLHALRPEITNSMLQGRLGDDDYYCRKEAIPISTIAGMPLEQYGYFQRIFEQVFLQEDRGSYKERLSEYGLRMFFVSGGEDPIVPPANILDASPREGTTMLSVAGMTHFLNEDPKDKGDRREKEQRDFWLPEAGGMIARAAIHAEQVHIEERVEAAKLKAKRKRPSNLSESLEGHPPTLLSNGYMFEAGLDWVLDAVDEEGGWLLVCRNMLPAAFLPSRHFTNWGTGLHHHDLRIQRYALGLRHRAGMLRKIKSRTTLIVPIQLERWFIDVSARFEPHSDAPAGRMTTRDERVDIWREFEKSWWPCIRHFDAGNVGEGVDGEALNASGFASGLEKWLEAEGEYLEATHLPDVWIGIRDDARLVHAVSRERKQIHSAIIEGIEGVLADLVKVREAPAEKRSSVKTRSKNRFEEDLEDDRIRILQISGAEFNPRYRGRIERSGSTPIRLLARAGAGLVRSGQITDPRKPDHSQ